MLRETTRVVARRRVRRAEVFDGVAEPDPRTGPLRVLIAEDNPVNQLILRTLLEELGLTLRIVDDGHALIEAWRGGVWDLVLTDIHMPVMDGVTAVRRIRAEEAERGLKPTPIIAVTADDTPRHLAEHRAAGIDSVVAKPFDLDQLAGAIGGLLEPVGLTNASCGQPAGSATRSFPVLRRASR
jgi:CheY-like chemotaxis protein